MQATSAVDRRHVLKAAGVAMAGWLTPVAHALAADAERKPRGAVPRSVILLWLAGGPSQLETFDPHPTSDIAGGTKAIDTAVRGVQLAEGLEQLAGELESIALVRNVVSREGDHERGTYHVKTGYRPLPTLVHPTLGAVCCAELPAQVPGLPATEVPRHISILPNQWSSWGGFLGPEYDAFRVYDPAGPVPNTRPRVSQERFESRFRDLDVVERAFARGRCGRLNASVHRTNLEAARRMMSSEQLAAFDVGEEPASVREEYGDTPFGRGCLAARRLIEVGVRCVEVTLGGWDSHVNNHEIHREQTAVLDPAFAALVRNLRRRELLDDTIVICAGEFGRTPRINRAGGRDHWPHGFSVALAGGRLRGGAVFGETDPAGERLKASAGVSVADVHATVLTALGLDPYKSNTAPGPRPILLSEGAAIPELLPEW